MKKSLFVTLVCMVLLAGCSPKNQYRTIAPDMLKDKIAGGWAGKMIGVTYGAPTEFRAQGKTYDDSINWTPADIKGSLWQDDLYVQLTFLMAMDQYGVDAPAKKFQALFARAGYPLWHANVQSRKNFYDSIFPPQSGSPEFNFHADDIDFQIEADYIGFMCPGMPARASQICEKVGHIMNYGDGLYGGIFVAALYAEAFFNNNIPAIVDTALKSIPAQSDYAAAIRDVIALHRQYPADWRAAWNALESRWGSVDICGAGSTFNIDAKLNGAYIVMGLLYGEGDPARTLEISTRCGQDSDCNPSNAMSVLGVIKGFSHLPEEMKKGIAAIGDSVFINTNYSFNKAVDRTYAYAVDFAKKDGGIVTDKKISIKYQAPAEPPLEVSFPSLVFDHRVSIMEKDKWHFKGKWQTRITAPQDSYFEMPKLFSSKLGDELEFDFDGTGVALLGNWIRDGGKADVYLDGKLNRTIDTYFYWNRQEHENMNLWHAFSLSPGIHHVKVVVKGEKRPESEGTAVYVTGALIFTNADQKPIAQK